jgi:hypothetical protein
MTVIYSVLLFAEAHRMHYSTLVSVVLDCIVQSVKYCTASSLGNPSQEAATDRSMNISDTCEVVVFKPATYVNINIYTHKP